MSYNIGQFRKTGSKEDYVNDVPFNIVDIQTESEFSEAIVFTDKALDVVEDSLVSTESYYLSFSVKRMEMQTQLLSVYLTQSQPSGTAEAPIQKLNTYTVEDGDPESEANFELIFTPNSNYDRIVIKLQRDLNDYNTSGGSRIITLSQVKLNSLKNILRKLASIPTELVKIGIQGPPGMLMCINGEEVRIGRSGIYEINNGYKITFIGIIIKDTTSPTFDGEDYFILDYQY